MTIKTIKKALLSLTAAAVSAASFCAITSASSESKISDVNLRILVNKILIHKNEDKSLDIKFEMNGDFNTASSTSVESENQLEITQIKGCKLEPVHIK
jgi:hypothetical protein